MWGRAPCQLRLYTGQSALTFRLMPRTSFRPGGVVTPPPLVGFNWKGKQVNIPVLRWSVLLVTATKNIGNVPQWGCECRGEFRLSSLYNSSYLAGTLNSIVLGTSREDESSGHLASSAYSGPRSRRDGAYAHFHLNRAHNRIRSPRYLASDSRTMQIGEFGLLDF